ncbi:MCE family protein [Prauserella oleivorans]|uniref:MCE family protein n=1 Tax=Prauserella oleivorans TaxID=1478153 RepID=A0ABW5WFL3_9PSEU
MRRTLLAAVAAVTTLTAGCGLSLQNTASLGDTGPTYRVTAVFSDVANLPLGGTVQVGQAVVGRVAGIRTEDFLAYVDLDITSDVDLPANTAARLELTSALGDEYVVLEPPPGARGGATLADAATIPLERTSRGPDVEHTLAALGTLLTGSGIDQVRTIVSEVNTALGGRTGEVKRLVHDLDSVLGSLDRRSGEIVGVIDSMHALSRRLAEGTPALEAALTDIRPALQVLLDERERFTTLLGNVGSLGTAAQGLLDKTGTALTEQLDQLRPVLRDLESLDGKLGPTLTALKDFADLVQRATPGDYLNLDGTIDVPLTVAELLDPDLGAAAPATARPEPGGLGDLLGGGAR